MPPLQCSCAELIQRLPFDEAIWQRTVEDYVLKPPKKRPLKQGEVSAIEETRVGENADQNDPFPTFMDLVTNRRPIEPGWLHRLRHGRASVETGTEYSLCVNLADVQRMQLRLLQGRLTWLAMSAGFDEDHGVREGVLTHLGPTLRDYGGFLSHSKAPVMERSKLQEGNRAILYSPVSIISTSRSRP